VKSVILNNMLGLMPDPNANTLFTQAPCNLQSLLAWELSSY